MGGDSFAIMVLLASVFYYDISAVSYRICSGAVFCALSVKPGTSPVCGLPADGKGNQLLQPDGLFPSLSPWDA